MTQPEAVRLVTEATIPGFIAAVASDAVSGVINAANASASAAQSSATDAASSASQAVSASSSTVSASTAAQSAALTATSAATSATSAVASIGTSVQQASDSAASAISASNAAATAVSSAQASASAAQAAAASASGVPDPSLATSGDVLTVVGSTPAWTTPAKQGAYTITDLGAVSTQIDLSGLTNNSAVTATLTASTTLVLPAPSDAALSIYLELTQDTTGGHTLASTGVLTPWGQTITDLIDKDPGAHTTLQLFWNGATWTVTDAVITGEQAYTTRTIRQLTAVNANTVPVSSLYVDSSVSGLWNDGVGNVYFLSNNFIFKIDGNTKTVGYFAGNGSTYVAQTGYTALGHAIDQALYGVVDSIGTTYYASSSDIYRILADGTIATFAGNGSISAPVSGAVASASPLGAPARIALYNDQTVFYSSTSSHAIYKISPQGIVSKIIGNNTTSPPLANGSPASGSPVGTLNDIDTDSSGSVLFVSSSHYGVYKVTPDGLLYRVVGTGGSGVAVDGAAASATPIGYSPHITVSKANATLDCIYVHRGAPDSRIYKITPDGILHYFAGDGTTNPPIDGAAASASPIGSLSDISCDSAGNVWTVDTTNGYVCQIDTNGIMHRFGRGVPSMMPEYSFPEDSLRTFQVSLPVFDQEDRLCFYDGNRILRMRSDGFVEIVLGASSSFAIPAEGTPASGVGMLIPESLAVDTDDNIYVADSYNYRAYKITADGLIHYVAGVNSSTTGPAIDGAAASASPIGQVTLSTYGGSVYVADYDNSRIYKITPDGILHYFAGDGTTNPPIDGAAASASPIGNPEYLFIGDDGSVYFYDDYSSCIYKITPDGILHHLAGSGDTSGSAVDGQLAVNASLYNVRGLAEAPSGGLYVAGAAANQVYEVTPDGYMRYVAGNGVFDAPVDGSDASTSPLPTNGGIATDSTGALYVAGSPVKVQSTIVKIETAGVQSFVPPVVASAVILTSPNGTKYTITVSDTGTVTATAV